MKRFVLLFVAVVNLLVVDAVTKELAAGYIEKSAPILVIEGFFDLAYVENRGCAWGMLQGQVWPLAVVGIIALILLIWQRKHIFGSSMPGAIAEPLIYAGILGNLIDRVVRGYVIDFLDFHWHSAHFPCFNIADICITCAAILILFTHETCMEHSSGRVEAHS